MGRLRVVQSSPAADTFRNAPVEKDCETSEPLPVCNGPEESAHTQPGGLEPQKPCNAACLATGMDLTSLPTRA